MDILITGAAGFVGKNLIAALEAIRDGKDRTRPGLKVGRIFAITRASTPQDLKAACAQADFVFHLAGVNRPEDPAEFMTGNRDLTAAVLEALDEAGNSCPVLLTSSVHGAGDTPYGVSKRAAEDLVFAHEKNVLVYRLPHIFGKWCRPFYNSAVATFCHQAAHDLPLTVTDPDRELELVYIDDLVAAFLDALEGKPCRDGKFCAVPVTHRAALGQIAEALEAFRANPLDLPGLEPGSLEGKLYAAYLSCLPREKISLPLAPRADFRGSFTELLRPGGGQLSVIVTKPGQTRGQHWHHSKWEIFVTVSGTGLIRQRKLGMDRVLEFPVRGDRPEAVWMLPGYTHSITNLSEKEDLVTLIWASEVFDPQRPDTYYEEVGSWN
ncbi:MAG: NAD-dependent epimerase/dehydratase family protein [Oscillospiraceae bacterium]|nr:NAD-dependent epimerase/dehydratase family protein [Oscillospiraceae bacterium]